MYDFALENGSKVSTMLAVAAAAIVLTGLFYYRAFRTLKRYQWQLLLVLRIVAILIVVLLLFRPVLSYEETKTERPALVFLVDTSASMSIADDASGAPRFQLARAKVEQWWDKLKTDFRLKVLEFSERAVPLERVEQLATLTPNGKSTSLFNAITSGAKSETGVQAIILLSDGIHNSAQNPLDAVKKLHGTVVHTVGVGASLRNNLTFRDVQVTGIECPDRMMINNKAKIVGSIEGIGLGGRVVHVILEEDGKTIQEAELTLDDIEGSQKVEFEYRPTVKGRHTYTVRVPPLPEEKIVENNHRNAVGMVVEPGIRVLYIEGTTRREYGALSSWFLAKDPDLEFCSMYQTRQNTFISRTNIQDLDLKGIPSNEETIGKFDVFILGDLDSSFIRSEQQKLIAQRVRERRGAGDDRREVQPRAGRICRYDAGRNPPDATGRQGYRPIERSLLAATYARGGPAPDLRQYRRLLPPEEHAGERDRPAGTGGLHQGGGAEAGGLGPGRQSEGRRHAGARRAAGR